MDMSIFKQHHSSKGFVRTTVLIWTVVCVIALAAIAYWFISNYAALQAISPIRTATSTSNTYGMSQYTDPTYGFSFWYPSALQITSTTTNDNLSFPGGIAVETLLIGSMGSTSIVVVNSPSSTITDEPNNHASPIAQTKYSYSSGQWMISYPEGINGPGPTTTTTADISKATISGLFMLHAGKRFDTTIIPLSNTQFLVISDGGGSSFTSQLAKTVHQTGSYVIASAQTAALQAEAAAYSNQ